MTKPPRKPEIAVKRGPGRPPLPEGAAVTVSGRVPQATAEAMEAWADANSLTRSAALALLLEAGLKRPPKVTAGT
jgi:hypothetical protein